MATIGKIRKNSTLLLIMIGGALLLFVLSDFLGSSGGSRQQQPEMAKLGKEKISARDFFTRLDEQLELYKQQYGDNINSSMAFQVREEVLNEMIRQTILQKEYKRIGLTVSAAEMADMMTGVNIHPIIRQNFTDPQTGQFNPAYVQQYLSNIDNMELAQQNQWYTLEKIMKEERMFNKYQTLVQKSYFIPRAMAVNAHKIQNQFASADIISLRYSDIKDEEITLNDKDFKKWYDENKFKYEQEESRWLQYVIFDVLPSEDDLKYGTDKVNEIYNEFIEISAENTRENHLFANLKSDLDFRPDTGFMKRTDLPAQADTVFNLSIGETFGPFSEGNSYFIMKVLDKQERADSLKASHILIAYQGAMRVDPAVKLTKEEAQVKADSLLKVVKGADSTKFAAIAIEHSNDQAANQTGGDMNWFIDGQMVPEFNEACINAKVNDFFVVETPFGFHVVKLTGKAAIERKIKLAFIKHTIEPSNETIQRIYTEASKFAGESKNSEGFNTTSQNANYNVRSAEYVRESDYSVPGVLEGREIVRWAFNQDSKEGIISHVFDLIGENKNVVVSLRQKREKGIAPLAQIKDQVEPEVRKMKKAEILIDKVEKARTGANDIKTLASKLGTDVQKVEYVSLNSPNVPSIGPEPKVVGTIYGTPLNQISKTVKGEAAVFVVVPTNFTEVPTDVDYSMVEMNLKSMFRNRVTYDLYNALLKKANVKNNKIFYY